MLIMYGVLRTVHGKEGCHATMASISAPCAPYPFGGHRTTIVPCKTELYVVVFVCVWVVAWLLLPIQQGRQPLSPICASYVEISAENALSHLPR
jgi:hypothetical protein